MKQQDRNHPNMAETKKNIYQYLSSFLKFQVKKAQKHERS